MIFHAYVRTSFSMSRLFTIIISSSLTVTISAKHINMLTWWIIEGCSRAFQCLIAMLTHIFDIVIFSRLMSCTALPATSSSLSTALSASTFTLMTITSILLTWITIIYRYYRFGPQQSLLNTQDTFLVNIEKFHVTMIPWGPLKSAYCACHILASFLQGHYEAQSCHVRHLWHFDFLVDMMPCRVISRDDMQMPF